MEERLAEILSKNSNFVSIDGDVIDLILDSFRGDEKQELIESWEEIQENIIDVFEGMQRLDIIMASGITFQVVFNELERIIPYYVPLLKASVNEFGDETYLEEEETRKVLGKESIGNQLFPKLLLSDGTRVYALMQVAAIQAGVNDDNLRLWYSFLQFLVGSSMNAVEH